MGHGSRDPFFTHSVIPGFIHQVFGEHLLQTRHGARHWDVKPRWPLSQEAEPRKQLCQYQRVPCCKAAPSHFLNGFPLSIHLKPPTSQSPVFWCGVSQTVMRASIWIPPRACYNRFLAHPPGSDCISNKLPGQAAALRTTPWEALF